MKYNYISDNDFIHLIHAIAFLKGNTGQVKKKCHLRRLVQICTFFMQLSCMVYFQYFLKICNFLVLQWPQKNPRTFFSLKIKSSEKQKCVNKLFLLKSKILKRLNHRILENLQIVIRKFAFFSSGIIFTDIFFQWFLRFQLNSVYLIL